MFRQPRAEQFEYYRALQSQRARPAEIKRQAKMRRRKKTKDQFARERRAEQAFKFGETRYGLSGRTIFQGTRSQDVDKRRSQYRPDRLLALHQSSLNNAARDANEIKRGMSAIGTTLGNERLEVEKVKVEKEKAQALRDFSNQLLSNPQNLLGYKSHRSPDDINSQYRQDIESGVIGGQNALDFLEALQERQDIGYKEHRKPADLNRQRSKKPKEAQADIEELPITPRPTPAQEAEKKDKRKAFLETSSSDKGEVFVAPKAEKDVLDSPRLREAVSGLKETLGPEPEPEPLPRPSQPKPKPKPKPKKKPAKGKGKVEEVKEEDSEYKLLKDFPTGKLTRGSDAKGWDESPFEFVDNTGVVGKKKKGKRYQIMNITGKNYSIVDSENENLAGWSSVSRDRMDKLVNATPPDISFRDNTFG